MRSTEAPRPLRWWALVATALGLGACTTPPSPQKPADIPATSPTALEPPPSPGGMAALPKPARPGDWTSYKIQAALRLVAANPDLSYTGDVPGALGTLSLLALVTVLAFVLVYAGVAARRSPKHGV